MIPDLPSWTWHADSQTLALWAPGRRVDWDKPDATVTGDLAERLLDALSWAYVQSRLPDMSDLPEGEPLGPSDSELGDWARTLRRIAEDIEERRT